MSSLQSRRPNLRQWSARLRRSIPIPAWLVRVDTAEAVCALTFDDGPDPSSTPLILDLLAQRGAKATFFVDGDSAVEHPLILERARSDGHVIGSHSSGHASATFDPRAGSLRRQVAMFRRSMAQIGSPTRWLRPPYGHESASTRLAAMVVGCRLVYWSDSPADWQPDSAEVLEQRIRQALRPGAIVLLHDGLLTAADERSFDRSNLIAALANVLADTPMRFVTIDELLHCGRPVLRWRPKRAAPISALPARRLR